MHDKPWYKSKTVQGLIGGCLFGILNTISPSPVFQSAMIAFLGFAGYGLRDAL